MALTDLQRPTKQTLYNQLQFAASEMNELMHRWNDMAEFMANCGTGDFDLMGVPTAVEDDTRAHILDFKDTILEMISFWNGNAVEPTLPPIEVVGKIRRMIR